MSVFSKLVSKHPVNNCVIAGASLTNSPWFTWADFLLESTQLPTENFSTQGAGNEYIVASLIKNQEKINQNSLVVVMFTNIDKFDWYVDHDKYRKLLNEKHQPKPISDNSGFWCTGSWFPLDKQIYQELFYSQDYFCAKTVQQILLLWQLCQAKQCNLLILFDSPIWSYTEQLINKIGAEKLDPLAHGLEMSGPYFDMWKQQLDTGMLDNYDRSLLGFCWNNKLAWHNQKMKGHPPSSSHFEFYNQVVRPDLEGVVKLHDLDYLRAKMKKFDELWLSGNK